MWIFLVFCEFVRSVFNYPTCSAPLTCSVFLEYARKGIPPYIEGERIGLSSSSVPDNHAAVVQKRAFFKPKDGLSMEKSWTWEKAASLPRPISTESDTVALVKDVMEDAIVASKMQFGLSGENKMDDKRPDILVIRKDGGMPVGVIEVKKPPRTNEKGDVDARIFGELYDYMMFLRSTYHMTPVYGLLTTYSEWYVCWLDGDGLNEKLDAMTLGTPPSTPPRSTGSGFYRIPCTPTTPVPSTPSGASAPATQETSPGPRTPSQLLHVFSKKESQDEGEDEYVDEECPHENDVEVKREMYVSQVFQWDSDKIWPMLVTVLWEMNRTDYLDPPAGSARYVARVSEQQAGLTWCHTRNGLESLRFGVFPRKDAKTLYIWENLGCGAHGRALLAATSSGSVCVIKCFFARKGQRGPLKEATRKENQQRELTCWSNIYRNKYKCREFTFLTRPAILLQYFEDIPVDERLAYVGKVKECLENDFHKNGYKHGDVKWRNIGRDAAGRAVVYDMGTVYEIEDKTDKSWIDEVIAELKRRA